MTPDDLRALADALDPSGKVLTHPGVSALQRAAEYLRACADAKPVAPVALVRAYNAGYMTGHHDTVEGGFVDIHPSDMDTYHADAVAELGLPAAPQAEPKREPLSEEQMRAVLIAEARWIAAQAGEKDPDSLAVDEEMLAQVMLAGRAVERAHEIGGSMTDAQTALAQVREALEAGPTPGEWSLKTVPTSDGSCHKIGPFPSASRIHSEAHACVYAIGIRLGIDDSTPVARELLANARLMAACSPANMTAILAHVKAQAAEIERLRAVVSALAFQANRDPFTTIGHWCEHGPCAAIIRDVSNPYADHHGPDWTQRDSEYLK